MTLPPTASSIWAAVTGPDPDALRPWLRWHPAELDDCVRSRGTALPPPLQAGELDEMRVAHERWGADAATLDAIGRLADSSARVVIAGQQPGLLAGPLYTVYKALGAVKLAESLRARHPGLHFIPVFWVASEDHDYEEVGAAAWPQPGGDLTEFRFAHPDWTPGCMVGTLPAGPVIEPLIQAVSSGTHDTEFRPAILDALRSFADGAPESRATWEDFFCRLLLWLLRDSGLVIVSPLMPWVRRRARSILGQEAGRPGESTRLILERSAGLRDAGLPTPLHRSPGAVNFFWVDQGLCRRTVRCDNGNLVVADADGGAPAHSPDGPPAGPSDAWLDLLSTHPAAFSTNVVTRPLVQDSILPTVAQLVGPGEAAYFAQVESVYESFGVFAPVRYPRPRVLLVERSVERTLQKFELAPLDVAAKDVGSLVRSIQERSGADSVAETLGALRERHLREALDLKSRLLKGGAAEAAVDKLVQAMERGYDAVAERHRDDRRRQEPQLEAALKKLHANLVPNGDPQERVFNPVAPFAIKYGPAWLAGLRAHLDVRYDCGIQIISPGA